MNLNKFKVVGKLTKTHKFNGIITAMLYNESFDFVDNNGFVYFVIDGKMVPFFAEQVKQNGKLITLKIQDIDNENIALKFINIELAFPLTLLRNINEIKYAADELSGYELVDNKLGYVGKVKTIIDMPQHQILQVFNKKNIEILIPMHKDFVTQINDENKQVYTMLPEGLLEIYL